jgi:AraC-like DNA-binding protein
VTLPAEQFTGLTDHWGIPDAREGSDQLLRMDGAAFARFTHTLGGAIASASADPAGLAQPDVATTMAGQMHDALWALAGHFGCGVDSAGRAARDCMRILRESEEYLRAHIERPIYSDELCRIVGVSPRKLHTAFVSVTGMSPLAYLKRRRLSLVRRALRSGQGDARLVKSIALAHGFWHLGNFAHDYREIFGEAPSETLSRARQAS